MQEGINRILCLIDFSEASNHAAEEAAVLAAKFNSELHLLHVTTKSFFFNLSRTKDKSQQLKVQFENLKAGLGKRYKVNILACEANGKLIDTVNKFVHDKGIDLVVISAEKKSVFKKIFPGGKIEKIINNIDSEVLCVCPESTCRQLKKIVIPVGGFIPKRKIKLAYELAKKYAARIYLILLSKNNRPVSEDERKVLMGSYQFLKDITNIPVECSTVYGENIAEAAIRFAKNIDADLILVNPGAESKLSSSAISKWSGEIVNHSPVPVLSVHSIIEKLKKKQSDTLRKYKTGNTIIRTLPHG